MRKIHSLFSQHKWDIILLSGLCIIALLGSVFTWLFREEGAYVIVKHDSQIVGRYHLAENQTIPLSFDGDQSNLLVIQDNTAFIESANCKDKLCVHQMRIRYQGQRIICLPHKLMIEIVGGDEAFDFVICMDREKGGAK